jgi:hypothetical protein
MLTESELFCVKGRYVGNQVESEVGGLNVIELSMIQRGGRGSDTAARGSRCDLPACTSAQRAPFCNIWNIQRHLAYMNESSGITNR